MKSTVRPSGSALLIILAFIVLISILVVGLMDTVRMERASAHSNLGALQAELIAQAGVEQGLAKLQQTTASNLQWISGPGQLIVSDTANKGALSQPISLSSGSVSNSIISDPRLSLRPANLNIPTFRNTSTHLLTEHINSTTGKVCDMPLAWVYVRKSGVLESATAVQPVTKNASNPIVGRFAYWADDESSKINYNLAWGRSPNNTAPMGDPSRIDLTALQSSSGASVTGPTADALRSYILTGQNVTLAGAALMGTGTGQTYHFFNTPESARLVPGMADGLTAYKMELTNYNADPDTNCFNERRIALTTQKAHMPVTSGTYLCILKDESKDPGDTSNVDPQKLETTLKMLYGYLTRKDWPMAPGSSFASKYYNSSEGYRDAIQFAVNIIEYVRCKEAFGEVVIPIRGDWDSTNQKWTPWAKGKQVTSWSYMGVTRAPSITSLSATLNASTLTVTAQVYSPPNYHLPDIDLSNYYFYVGLNNLKGPKVTNGGYAQENTVSGLLKSGSFVMITSTFPPNILPNTSNLVCSRVALGPAFQADRVDIVPLIDSGTNISLHVNVDTLGVNDPRVNKNTNDWKQYTPVAGKIGRYLEQEVTSGGPQQDTVGGGLPSASNGLSDASLYMPSLKGKGDNPTGLVTSVAELGYITTGVRINTAGVPWRSIRLQPNSGSFSTVPDWAFLDLFSVPVSDTQTNAITYPNKSSFGGRVNMNSGLESFSLNRILPLAAVFQGVAPTTAATGTLSAPAAQNIARNIYNRIAATSGTLYNLPNGYYSPYEMVEIEDVADGGEQSEELVREVSNLLTVRGNVYTLYSIGESIQQTPSGELQVTGQKRLQAMVERYSDTSGSVRFRTVYYRTLSP